MSTSAESPRILLIEDLDGDAELMLRELRLAGLACTSERVQSEASLLPALRDFAPDVVLSDHSLPGFTGQDVLRIVHSQCPHTPVIIVTGSLDEETAADYIKAGAAEYIVKHRLFRLPPAVTRALALRQALDDAAKAEAALRQLEEQTRQVHKMEAIGRLASGVAHDFNNVLTVITTCCELMLEDHATDAPALADVREIGAAARRGAALTRQLLAFSRDQEVSPQRVDLNELVANMTGMLGRLLTGNVALQFVAAPGLKPIWADPGQLEQVVMNLAMNGRDAMPHGGTVSIATRSAELDATAAGRLGVQPGPFAILVVTDTGSGMDAETRARLFEPFFTTKPKGKGTGLGLATVYGIVQRAGGGITVDSEPGRGTTFEVYLPHDRRSSAH